MKKKKMPWYKRFPADYGLDTTHLSMMEDGAYTRMLDSFYASQKPLPKDKERLYRALRVQSEEEKRAVDFVLAEFWTEQEDGYVNARAQKEIEKAQKQAATNQRIAQEREDAKRARDESGREEGTSGSTDGQPSHSIHPLRRDGYIAETQHLTMTEHGAYYLMLGYTDWTGKPLPKDRPLLDRALRVFTAEEQTAVGSILDEFWMLTERGWIHPRMEEYREKTQKRKAIEAHRQWARKQLPRLALLQKNLCGICGTQFTREDEIEADHILPISKFPEQTERRELTDIQAVHKLCNRKKRDRVLGEGLQ